MLEKIKAENILFLDIETAPLFNEYSQMPDPLRILWDKKAGYLGKNGEPPEELYPRSGIYAEFGKIICISTGRIKNGNPSELLIQSFYGDNEEILLRDFSSFLDSFFIPEKHFLCAHNGKEFDYPYIARRMLVNRLPLPDALKIAGRKPWEIRHLDTMELWRFGDYKNYTPLNLLAAIFNLPSPKNDIDGSMVGEVYWKEKNLKRIAEYCGKDVVTIAQLFLRYQGRDVIEKEFITFA